MAKKQSGYLFEVSWEVCNKVGGIYTVITSKLPEAMKVYGDDYYLLGPDLKTNIEFEETDEDCWTKIRGTLPGQRRRRRRLGPGSLAVSGR